MKKNKICLIILTFMLSATCFGVETNLNLKFTGIDIIVDGEEGVNFAYERLWYDQISDDDIVLYLHSDVPVFFRHNDDNIIGFDRASSYSVEQQGDIFYKIDGDELRGAVGGHKYATYPRNGAPTAVTNPLYRNVIIFKYEDTGAFTMAPFKGKVNSDNGTAHGENGHYHWGLTDEYGDEWHTLTYWDDDPLTNRDVDRRSLATSDGKIVQVVIDPKTAIISFKAFGNDEYYTTPPKTYYTSKIHKQITYLTGGVVIKLTNITNQENVWYRINNGQWEQYDGELTASTIFMGNDTQYNFEYRVGTNGVIKKREIHYNPSQPAQNESHPKLRFNGFAGIDEMRNKVSGGDDVLTSWYDVFRRADHYQGRMVDYRCGLRNIDDAYNGTGYHYLTKTMAGYIYSNAFVGLIDGDNEMLERTKNGLLMMYVVDPVGCEDGDGRNGGPCQERAMYSDGRCTTRSAEAYDMIFHFTTDNGYVNGVTPIQHIKIRDNLANEASVLLKYPETWPKDFFTSLKRDFGGTRAMQLETTNVSYALAMPTYDTHYYGTSGADGVTNSTHLFAPLLEMPIAWSDLHFKGEIVSPIDSSMGRRTAVNDTFDVDGWYIGGAREGYIGMMYQDLVPYLVIRNNFDGHHYDRIEKHLRHECIDRYPFNGSKVPTTFYQNGFAGRRIEVDSLVSEQFADASLYRWSLEFPEPYDRAVYADSSIQAQPPQYKKLIGNNFAIFSSDFNDPKSIFFRVTMLNSVKTQQSGTFLHCFEGHFNLTAYGERLAIENAGYHELDYREGTNSLRKNVIIVDGLPDNNYAQFKGGVTNTLSDAIVEYVCMKTDHSLPGSERSAFAQNGINQARHVLFPDRKFIVMYDQLTSSTGEHEYSYLLHGTTGGNNAGDAHMRDLENDRAVWKKPSGVSLIAQFVTDVELNQTILTQEDFIDETGQEPYVSAKKFGQNISFLTVLYPCDAGQSVPEITRLNEENYSNVTIQTREAVYLAAARNVPGNTSEIKVHTVQSNSDFAFLKHVDGVWEYIVCINALNLAIETAQLFSSDKPVNIRMKKADQDGKLFIFYEIENLTSDAVVVSMISDQSVQVSLSGHEKISGSYNYAQGLDVIIDSDPHVNPDADGDAPDVWGLHCYNNIVQPGKSPAAQLNIEVKEDAHVSVIIYDSKGRKVKTIYNEHLRAGSYPVDWLGTDDSGSKVGSGIYIVHMVAGGYSETKKVAVIK